MIKWHICGSSGFNRVCISTLSLVSTFFGLKNCSKHTIKIRRNHYSRSECFINFRYTRIDKNTKFHLLEEEAVSCQSPIEIVLNSNADPRVYLRTTNEKVEVPYRNRASRATLTKLSVNKPKLLTNVRNSYLLTVFDSRKSINRFPSWSNLVK